MFTQQQQEVIRYNTYSDTNNRILFVNSCAGSGKTTCMLENIKYMQELYGNSLIIRVISLTNRISAEIGRKINNNFEYNKNITVSTFHKFIYELYFGFCGGENKINIIHSPLLSVKHFARKLKHYSNKEFEHLWNLYLSDSNNRSAGYYGDCLFVEALLRYDKYKGDKNLIDFNDVLNIFLSKFEADIHFQEYVLKNSVDIIYIDEIQDLSDTEFNIINKCFVKYSNEIKSAPSLFFIGDFKQSIFGFKNGYSNIIEDYLLFNQDIEKKELTYNFRCQNSDIISVANKLSNGNMINFFNSEDDVQCEIVKHSNSVDMYDYVYNRLLDKTNNGCSVGILYRNIESKHKFKRYITDNKRKLVMRENGTEQDRSDTRNFLLSILEFIKFDYLIKNLGKNINYNDDIIDFLTIFIKKLLGRKIGYKGVKENIIQGVIMKNISDKTILEHFYNIKEGLYIELPNKYIEKTNTLVNEFEDYFKRTKSKDESAADYYKHIIANYFEDLYKNTELSDPTKTFYRKVDFTEHILPNINIIIDSIIEMFPDYSFNCLFERDFGGNSIENLLTEYYNEKLLAYSLLIIGKNEVDISLTTIHSAKGLEYEEVHIINVNNGIFPRDNLSNIMLREEIRVLYVAITRAKKRLYIHTIKDDYDNNKLISLIK